LKAIELGAESITFTDHAPFPGDPFFDRMRYENIDEYINSLKSLREKYKNDIMVRIGLEIEFLPSYIKHYEELKRSGNFDILMIGQHFYECELDKYSFSLDHEELNEKEFVGCGKAIVTGINTGLFDVVAHPDRIFRRRREWTSEMEDISMQIVEVAKKNNVLLEQNESSKQCAYQYWEEFWKLVPQELIINGLDAHSVKELN
jgi:histidinol-phosphatase (PHP family)